MAKNAHADHRARWLHNRAFIAILPDEYADWMLTGAFYAAVHAVESLIAFDRLPNHASHETRNRTLKTVRRYQQIWKHYHELYNGSQTSRYHCDPNAWIPAQDIKQIWIPHYLYPIERSVLKLIGDPGALPPITWQPPPVPPTPPSP